MGDYKERSASEHFTETDDRFLCIYYEWFDFIIFIY